MAKKYDVEFKKQLVHAYMQKQSITKILDHYNLDLN